jgi:hypothetical protein
VLSDGGLGIMAPKSSKAVRGKKLPTTPTSNNERQTSTVRPARMPTRATKPASATVASASVRSPETSSFQQQSSQDVLGHEGRERRNRRTSEGGKVAGKNRVQLRSAVKPARKLARLSARKVGQVLARKSTQKVARQAGLVSDSHQLTSSDSDGEAAGGQLSVSDDEHYVTEDELDDQESKRIELNVGELLTDGTVSRVRRGKSKAVSPTEVRRSRPVRTSGTAGVGRRVDASASDQLGEGRFGYAGACGKTPRVRQQPNAVRSPGLVVGRNTATEWGSKEVPDNETETERSRSASGQLRKRIDHSISMPVFDGEGDLELFLNRFDMLADYFEWEEPERLFRLRHCIRGDAQYMLTDTGGISSITAFVDILRHRFRAASHAERYRAELSRLRMGTMTLEKLHLKVRGLVSKAYPGPWSVATEIYARDAFLSALGDPELRRRILMTCPPPETLEDAYDLAVRSAAVEDSLKGEATEQFKATTPKRSRYARTVTAESTGTGGASETSSEAMKAMDKRLEALQDAFERWTAAQSTLVADEDSMPQSKVAAGRKKHSAAVDRDTCRRCGEKGHWARECPKASAAAARFESKGETINRPKANVLSGSNRRRVRVYSSIQYQGKDYPVLLDTGCDESIIGVTLLPGLSYRKVEQTIYAANKARISILGRSEVEYQLGKTVMTTSFWVSDEINEIIFGADWLEQNSCLWDFKSSTLKGHTEAGEFQVSLCERVAEPCVRRVYVKESVEISPRTQLNLPVRSVWTKLPIHDVAWTVGPKEVRPGVVIARTLLATSGAGLCVRVINCTNDPYKMEAGRFLSVAERVSPLPEGAPDKTEVSFQHVQGLIDNLPEQLSREEKERAIAFIKSYAHVFSSSNTDLGRNRLLPHRINTGDRSPVRQPLRRQPYAQVAEIERNVQDMLGAKLIEPTTSPWSSNVLLVKKRDGTMRFCVDYRKLNERTVKESYPLPRLDSCLESLGGNKIFSTLDLRAGYWQTELDPNDAEKTAFITRSGQYKFTVLSMGLVNAPSQFQRLMDLVLAGLLWDVCLTYLDDVIVFSKNFDEHLERLAAVLSCLAKANLKLKASKCQLFQQEVRFLGHVISAQGIATDPDKIKVVENWPRPRNLQEVRSFLGLASYYRRYVARFADQAKALHLLTNKGQPFIWGDAQEQAFRSLKRCLISAPILASPVDDADYVLDTDASLTGLGAVLHQRQGEHLKVIGYGSRVLSKAERNYSTTRRELLAVIFGFSISASFCWVASLYYESTTRL